MSKKFKVVIERIKKDIHEMDLGGDNIMTALDAAREMVEKRNQLVKKTGEVFSVKRIEEIKDE